MKLELNRVQEPFQFELSNEDGAIIKIDAKEDIGGSGQYFRPMQLLAGSLAGCTSIDVLLILGKQKLVPVDYQVEVQAERVEEHPQVFKSIHLIFKLKGELPEEKVKRAVDLSMTKYCSVTKMLEKACEITYSIELNKNT
ncbi:MAG: OsmC family protein [Crocinitomicaceae bacterium]|nr:OsmC family protein [Crocinitomicaceae bacterium]